jgi:hypothetical protein
VESRHAQEVVNRLKSKQHEVKVSLLAIGESVKVYSEDSSKLNLEYLVERIRQNKITLCWPEVEDYAKLAKIAEAVKEEMAEVGTLDVLHLAHAWTDKSAKGLLTFDGGIINNPGIARLRKHELWREGFRVSNESGV